MLSRYAHKFCSVQMHACANTKDVQKATVVSLLEQQGGFPSVSSTHSPSACRTYLHKNQFCQPQSGHYVRAMHSGHYTSCRLLDEPDRWACQSGLHIWVETSLLSPSFDRHHKHRKNCESCPTQVTWKIKFKCQFCLYCMFFLTCLSFLCCVSWLSCLS